MKIWMPFLAAGTGADVSTRYLAEGLRGRGHDVVLQAFSKRFEPAPWLLKGTAAPVGCDAIITNTWNGFAFARRGIPMVTVDRLFVLDPALSPYKSTAQKIYHNALIRSFVRRSALAADAVVAVSQYTADVFARQLALPHPQVILNAVDTDFFRPSGETGRPRAGRPWRLLYVGTLSRRKGADLLAPIMRALGSDYELRFTGHSSAAVLGKNLPANMHPLGSLSQEEVLAEYRSADLLVFPSRGEGLARAVMESLACGTPVVVTKASSMPEAVDETVGRLFSPDDTSEIVAAVRSITTSTETLGSLSANARQRALSRFALDRMLDDFEGLLSTLEAGGKHRSPQVPDNDAWPFRR